MEQSKALAQCDRECWCTYWNCVTSDVDTMSEVKKTPEQWCEELGYKILDPDGWRSEGDPPFDEPLTYEEFWPRLAVSTIMNRR
jgi:hypothetical protein